MTAQEYRADMPEPFGCGLAPCRVECGSPFARLYVMPAPRGGAAIHWQLIGSFSDPTPHTVQLQVSEAGTPTADDWADVGAAVVDGSYVVDPTRRSYGAIEGYYRLKLSTSAGEYYSSPTSGLDVLPAREWRLAQEALRRKRLAMRTKGWDPGWLIKRATSREKCHTCTGDDGMPTRSDCPDCLGTGLQCPYYYPIPCVYAQLKAARYRTDNKGDGQGTTSERIFYSEMPMVPLIDRYDLWVSSRTHMRYRVVSDIQPVVGIHGILISANVTLAQLDASDVAYDIPIDDPLDDIYGD